MKRLPLRGDVLTDLIPRLGAEFAFVCGRSSMSRRGFGHIALGRRSSRQLVER